jgi:hypothetical protein
MKANGLQSFGNQILAAAIDWRDRAACNQSFGQVKGCTHNYLY